MSNVIDFKIIRFAKVLPTQVSHQELSSKIFPMELYLHCVKSVQIRNFFRSVFCHIRTEYYLSVFSLNAGKYGPEKTPYLDTVHIVLNK